MKSTKVASSNRQKSIEPCINSWAFCRRACLACKQVNHLLMNKEAQDTRIRKRTELLKPKGIYIIIRTEQETAARLEDREREKKLKLEMAGVAETRYENGNSDDHLEEEGGAPRDIKLWGFQS